MSRADRAYQRQAEILSVAAKFVAERGYHGMSMRELAKATGKNISTLYNDFPSKEALLFAIQLRAFENLCDTAEDVTARQPNAAAVPASDRLFSFIYQHVHYVICNADVMRLLVSEAGALDAEHRGEVRAVKTRYFNQLRAIVAEVCGCELGEACVELSTYNIFGMLNWVYGWHEAERHGDAETIARSIYRLAMGGVASCTVAGRALVGGEPPVPELESINLLDPAMGHEARAA
jgi:AcrR family transcriptional regulator